jgi:hypothetical protein
MPWDESNIPAFTHPLPGLRLWVARVGLWLRPRLISESAPDFAGGVCPYSDQPLFEPMFHSSCDSVPEVTDSGEDHRHVAVVGRGNDLFVAD